MMQSGRNMARQKDDGGVGRSNLETALPQLDGGSDAKTSRANDDRRHGCGNWQGSGVGVLVRRNPHFVLTGTPVRRWNIHIAHVVQHQRAVVN
jgi:hypothetical protein